jgi:putative copper export protein
MFTVLHGLHLLSIAAALGGTIVLRFVVCPMIPGTEEGQETRQAILGRWRPIVWILIAVILVTGLANSHQAYMRVGPDFVYWSVFMVKFFSALALFGIVLMLTLPTEAFDKFRQERDKWMHFIVAIGTLILFLSAYLRINFPKLLQ